MLRSPIVQSPLRPQTPVVTALAPFEAIADNASGATRVPLPLIDTQTTGPTTVVDPGNPRARYVLFTFAAGVSQANPQPTVWLRFGLDDGNLVATAGVGSADIMIPFPVSIVFDVTGYSHFAVVSESALFCSVQVQPVETM